MKKFIMTAIVICLSIATAIPFNSVKAMTQSRIETNKQIIWNGDVIGWYNNYAYFTSGNEYINTSQFDIGPVGYYKTVNVITMGFNYPITGEIQIGFDGSLSNYSLVYIDGDNTGAYRWSGSNQVLYVSMDNCQSFDIYLYSTTQYTSSNIPTKIYNIAFTSFTSSNAANNSSYQIPIYSVPAYAFTVNYAAQVQYQHGDMYPTIIIDANWIDHKKSNILYLTNTYNQYKKYYYIAIIKAAANYEVNVTNGSYTSTRISPYYGGYGIYQFAFWHTGTPAETSTFEIEWTDFNEVIPIYFGTESNCPTEIRGICGFTNPLPSIATDVSNIEMLLNELVNLNGDQGQTSQDIGNLADDFGDIADDEHQISSGFQDDLDDFNESIDLQDYDFLTGIANASEYFKIQLENVFNNSVNLRAMWVLPVICIVLLKLLGG